jgi:HK97 gp10 family phage protein
MATTFSVEIQNADNLISRFQNIADSLPREIGNALTDSAESIVDNAQANAPVDTGYLRDHIIITQNTDEEVTIESQADYSVYVEFGTRYMDAQPYFMPAVEAGQAQLLTNIENAIDRVLAV